MCDSPDSNGWRLCPLHLVDAQVIDVKTYRVFAEKAYAMMQMYDADAANNVMPPHCILLGQLQKYAQYENLHEDEIALVVQFDFLLTSDIDEDTVIAVTIGC
jgi:hypothetical protein